MRQCETCGELSRGKQCGHCGGHLWRLVIPTTMVALGLVGLSACKAQNLYGAPAVTPVVEDEDADGFSPPEDCDDEDADRYPGAPETAGDGVDSDCDGEDDPADTGA